MTHIHKTFADTGKLAEERTLKVLTLAEFIEALVEVWASVSVENPARGDYKITVGDMDAEPVFVYYITEK